MLTWATVIRRALDDVIVTPLIHVVKPSVTNKKIISFMTTIEQNS